MQETFDYDFAEYNGKIGMQIFLDSLDYKSQSKIIGSSIMNNARQYIENKMKDENFRRSYVEEKLKIDLEFIIDELNENIKNDKPKNELLKGVKKLKRVIAHA